MVHFGSACLGAIGLTLGWDNRPSQRDVHNCHVIQDQQLEQLEPDRYPASSLELNLLNLIVRALANVKFAKVKSVNH